MTARIAAVRPMEAIEAEIVREMAGLEDGIARYQYLVAQGRALGPAEPGLRTDANAVPGCQATVWIRADLEAGRLWLQADSDAGIVRGIVALLLRVLDGRPPAEVRDATLGFLDATGLRAHLSPARANGLSALVERIRAAARARA